MHSYNIPFPKNIMVKYRLYILPSKQSHKMEKGMDKTYTFIAEYRGGTYISQCISKDLVMSRSIVFIINKI